MTEDGKATEKAAQRVGEADLTITQLPYWESILESISDGFWVLDQQWRCNYINDRQAELIGMEKNDVLGKNIWELLPQTIGTEIYIQLHRAVTEKTPVHFEYFQSTWQGWFESRVYPFENGVCVFTLDISDRKALPTDIDTCKEAQDALYEREQHLKVALQAGKLGSWQTDLATGTLSCSDECKANFGLPPDAEFTHQTLFAALHPEDRDRVQTAIHQAIEERTDYEVEERCFWPDGTLHWLIARGRLIYDANNTPIRMVGVTLDITERKKFEESLKVANQRITNILESITDAFVAFDSKWRYTYVNKEASRFLQRPVEELLGKRWQDVFPEADRSNPQIYQKLYQAVAKQVTIKFESFSFAANCWLEVNAFPFPDGLVVYFRDISDRKLKEQRQATQYAVTRVLAEATTLTDAVPAILQSLCESLGWQLGIIWSVDKYHNVLRYVNSWQLPTANQQEFIAVTQQTTFAPGIGLPGRIWATHQSCWIPLISEDNNFIRTESATKGGLNSVFGFPILLGNEILGVIECFSDRIQEPDQDLLQMMAAIGSQIGQFIERKRTQEALQETQALFESFMNHSPATAFIKDEAGRYIYVNRLNELQFHRPLADWVGKTDFDLFPTTAAEQLRHNDLAVISTGQVLKFVETTPLEDGEHSYISFKFPLQSPHGQRLLAGMSIDITDRVRVEKALRQSEEKYRSIFETVGVSLWEEDFSQIKAAIDELKAQGVQDFRAFFAEHPDFVQQAVGMVRVINVNHTTVRMFEAEDKNQLLTSLDQIFVPETLEVFVAELLSIADEKTFFESETILKTLQGKYINVIFTITFPPPTATFESVLVSIIDITDRKQAEETLKENERRLSLALSAAKAGIWEWDIATNKTFWSEENWRLLGYEPGCCESNYDTWLRAVYVEDRNFAELCVKKALEKKTSLKLEYRILLPDGTFRWLNDVGEIIFNADGEPKGMRGIQVDITELKNTEAALRSSAEQLSLAFAAANMGNWTWDSATDIVTFSQRGAEIFGIPPSTYVTWTQIMGDLIHEQDREQTNLAVEKAIREGGDYDVEYRVIYLDQTQRWVAAKGRAQYNICGQVIGMLGVVQDITDRKQVEQEREQLLAQLETERSRFEAVLRQMPGGVIIAEAPCGKLVLANQQVTQLLGESIDPSREIEQHDQFAGFYPDGRPYQPSDWPMTRALLNGEIIRDEDVEIRRKDGNRVIFRTNAAPIRDQTGHIVAGVVTFSDITEQRRIEQERINLLQELQEINALLDTFFNNAPIGFGVWNEQLRYVRLNPALAAINGQTQQAHIGKTVAEILPGVDAGVMQAFRHVVTTGESVIAQEASGETPAAPGKHRYWSISYYPIKLPGNITWVGAVCEEITERKQVEIERSQLLERERKAREQAETANRIKDEFLAVLSHELRSPLNPILGWTRLLRTRKFDEQAIDRALETIERNAKLQTKLIEDLLDVSRILQGKMVLNIASVHLTTVIEAALETVRLAAEAKGIAMQIEIISELEVSGDAARLQQIVWNLLSNAVKFTSSGGQIEIKLEQIGLEAQIQVKDTGKGISAKFLPHVFEYFRQEDGKTTRQFGGLGLGLAIVRHLTELHGGTVGVESLGEGLGATFTVKLPLKKTDPQIDQDNTLPIENSDLSQLRILIVDDEADMRELLVTILEVYGAQVTVATSAAEVLSTLDQYQPDILISDIGMPDTDGYMLMRQIRTRSPQQGGQIPAIALTAYAGEYDQRQALNAGFQLHVSKPVVPEELISAIAQVLNK